MDNPVTPPITPGFYPFWFWNDDLTAAEVRRQIGEMADKGVKGFFIHPRQGLCQPYLSAAFFEMVAAALDEAQHRGLQVHLYDEYPYPSGVAGGEVTLGQPHFIATRLLQKTYDVDGGVLRIELPAGKVLACVAYPLRQGQVDWSSPRDLCDRVGVSLARDAYFEWGLTRYNRKRYFAAEPTPVLDAELPARPHRLFVSIQAIEESHKYWGHFSDVMNPKAVREFLRRTHEAYHKRFARYFGTVIRSIFVDETEPRWTEQLPEVFRTECGYDLLPLLSALQDQTHPQHLQVTADLRRVQYKLFCQAWEQPYADWCSAHGIAYSGEKPSWRLAQLRYMDIPGCEPGHTKAGAPMDLLRPEIRSNARATASAAYFYNKPSSLCECYHSMGWAATLQDARLIADGLLLMGIEMLVPHGFFYSTHGLRKHDAPPTFFFQVPHWHLFDRLTARVDRIAAAFAGTHIDARVLLVEPSWGLPSAQDRQSYQRLLDTLMAEHIDFLMVDTDIVSAGAIAGGQVRIRHIAADLVIVPPMRTIEPALEQWLATFERAGGKVLHWNGATDGATLRRFVSPSLPISGAGSEHVQMVTRTDGTRRVWMLLNTSGQPVDLVLRSDHPLQEIPLEDGLPARLARSSDVPAAGGDSPDRMPRPSEHGAAHPDHAGISQAASFAYVRTLAPFEAVSLHTAEQDYPLPAPPRVTIRLDVDAHVTPLSANLLRLGDWRMALIDEAGAVLGEALVAAVPLANQLAAGKFRFAPHVRERFGQTPQLALPPLTVRYTTTFENHYDGLVYLVMEPGSIVGNWSLRVNDAEPLGPAALAPVDLHVRGSLGAGITRQLRPGTNTLTIEVLTDRLDGGLRNPLYLAGGFAVRLAGPTLTRRKPNGRFEANEDNGLPYYAGAIEYRMDIHLDADIPPGPVLAELDFGPTFEDAAEVSINEGPWQAVPWSPRIVPLPAGRLHSGANRIAVRVYTTLVRAFEGQAFDPVRHAYHPVADTGQPGDVVCP